MDGIQCSYRARCGRQQKLNKAKSSDKIDGVMALNCAVAEMMTRTASDDDEIPDDYIIRTL